jgi:dolichol-phosphate mannosyltransferase
MDRAPRTLVLVPVWNEADRVGAVIDDLRAQVPQYDVLVIDDGSTDATAATARCQGCTVISHPGNLGIGAAIRTGIRHAQQQQYDILVVVNGTGKTPARGIPALLAPIVNEGFDFVQGSRYLTTSSPPGREDTRGLTNSLRIPFHRSLGTRVYSRFFSWFAGRTITDGTSGFRALRMSMLQDSGFQLDQTWLNRYELEPYLYYQSIRLGYRVKEVGVEIVYPHARNYTKMRVLIDWWRIFRPLLFLWLGLRR